MLLNLRGGILQNVYLHQWCNNTMTRVFVSGHSTKALTSLETSVLGSWESSTADFGLGTLFAHLETSRKFGDSLSSFRRNAEIVLGDSKVSFEIF